MRPTYRDIGRPDLRTLGDVARFISNECNVPYSEVVAAQSARLERRGVRWAPDAPLEDVRRQVLAALDGPTRTTEAAAPVRRRTVRKDDPAAARVARLFRSNER